MNSIQKTQIDLASGLAKALNIEIDLRIKRDDLYPQFGGGSKARKIIHIVNHAINAGYDTLVTNGGPQSNHARATALIAAQLGLKCHLVIVVDLDTNPDMKGNLLLMKLSGASVEYCKKSELAYHMDKAISLLSKDGYKPYYIWGGGHCVQGTYAFVDAAREAQNQCGDWEPDYVFLASGTGTTQAGLTVGYAGFPTQIIGISVARDQVRGTKIIQESIVAYCSVNNYDSPKVKVILRDDWIYGGYEHCSQELIELIFRTAKVGYLFDPTYTGKALMGLVRMVNQSEIPIGSKVLFWHTGGLFNLLSSDHILSRLE